MDIRQLILPSGVGLTHIAVYTEPGPDGNPGGGAHLHSVCSEIYYVLAGTGTLELLSFDGLVEVPLKPFEAAFFRPGVIHRVVNPNRDLQILSIMQSGALPERGDFVMTFPDAVLTDAGQYQAAVRVNDHAEAVRRRDLSLEGYLALRKAMQLSRDQGRDALRRFYRRVRELVGPKVDGFEWVLKSGAQDEVKACLDACDFLRAGQTAYLERATHGAIDALTAPVRMGMAGELHAYAVGSEFLAEGRKVA